MPPSGLFERWQTAIFAVAIAMGIALGSTAPQWSERAEAGIVPVLALLLYATFLQVRVRALPEALRDRRFLGAALLANFVAVPILVWGLLTFIPVDPAIRVGIVIVLLAPCTDWFTSFTHLGRGDTRLAIALTPLLLAMQFPLLPLYLWVLTDIDITTLPLEPILRALVFVILLPLAAVALTQGLLKDGRSVEGIANRLLVPLLALTLLLVATSESPAVREAGGELGRAVAVFVLYLVGAAVIAKLAGRLFGLGTRAKRTLAFNLGTRNSFVVLPIALALPATYALAAPVIAAQVLVELVGMLLYLRWVPRSLFPGRDE